MCSLVIDADLFEDYAKRVKKEPRGHHPTLLNPKHETLNLNPKPKP